jgi:hypothetical protein
MVTMGRRVARALAKEQGLKFVDWAKASARVKERARRYPKTHFVFFDVPAPKLDWVKSLKSHLSKRYVYLVIPHYWDSFAGDVKAFSTQAAAKMFAQKQTVPCAIEYVCVDVPRFRNRKVSE